MMVCEGCGNKEARNVRIVFVPTAKAEDGKVLESMKEESCDQCRGVKPSYFRDAMGNKVRVPIDNLNKYSYAIDAPILGTKQYSEHLKRNDLMIKET